MGKDARGATDDEVHGLQWSKRIANKSDVDAE
jgi:hypothetical protein